jgi:protein-export membrane protein SecD
MLHFSKIKLTVILGIILLGVIFSIPNLFPRDDVEKWPSWMPKTVISLGLDLQGGSHLLYEVDIAGLENGKLASAVKSIRDKLRSAQPPIGYVAPPVVANGAITLKLLDPKTKTTDAALIDRARPLLQEATTGMNLTIGDDGQVTAGYAEDSLKQLKQQVVEQVREVVLKRLDATGTKEPTVIREGEDRLVVQLPGVKDPQRIKDIIGKTAKMSFHPVDETAMLTSTPGPDDIVVPDADPQRNGVSNWIIAKDPLLGGQNLVDAQQSFQNGAQPVVQFKFDSAGGRIFGDFTSKNVGRHFAVVLDGKVITAPVIRDAILGGDGVISGNFTTQSAADLALQLRAGALPADLHVIEERTVGADLGADSIAAGEKACLIAIVLIVIAMLVLYGLFGIFANIALLLNAVLILGALSLLGATLTFPGIAGMVLTLGMAVDANVLILERVREEMRNGRGAVTAMEAGYREAQATIIDANVTHFIATCFLFYFGSGPIKGFAITLIIGIATSFFTSVYVTRLMTSVWLRRTKPKLLPL